MEARSAILLIFLGTLLCGAVAGKAPAFSLVVSYEAGQIVDSPGGNFTAVTNYRTFAGQIYDKKTLKLLGFADGVATVVKATPKFTIFVVEFSLVFLKKGQIITYGYLDSSLAVNSYAVTGGTGKFQGASGEVVFKFSTPPFKFKTSIVELVGDIYLK
eukprot:TRINITY_DN2582_c0_g1_i3.p1 TRINITY_DN2582_c0_g1~~TRINITY_DN2582_c0_g1_i3.p1  ORF type:complete len:158 (-),score=25.34 TRINITY_DN2582_c0_g1_i3:551-1024(-)